jgi:hypothetical protein
MRVMVLGKTTQDSQKGGPRRRGPSTTWTYLISVDPLLRSPDPPRGKCGSSITSSGAQERLAEQ